MKAQAIVLIFFCITMMAFAGCTGTPPAAAPATTPAPAANGTPATTGGPAACTVAADCVPAQCCHPTSYTTKANAPKCDNTACTESCEGPLDCGAGSCGCANGTCTVIPAASGTMPAAQKVTVKLEASPQRYSPIMSSTPGVRLAPTITGFVPAESKTAGNATDIAWSPVTCEWNATFGTFLKWEAPDYTVHQIGNPVADDCGTVYWTFIDKPASTKEPVTVTVTARDATRQGAVLEVSTVTLDWDGDYAVYVGKIA
ncbi:MAG: hypothetical protein A4E35_01553 [Methanoregula sp. PtaU1.Bin051]|nr:MAG: hypothetical protein A4E35_01553 [Methanoregula sp. PtaU1.Bin051]